MRFTKLIAVVAIALAIAVLVPAAHADTITFTLTTSTGTNFPCASPATCGPFGTIVVTMTGTNTATVTETLASGIQFVNTGAGHALEFNISGDPSITITGLTTGFAGITTSVSGDGGGTFDYGIDCTSCASGGSNPNPGPLSFTVTSTGSLTAALFNLANGNGFVVASDVIDNNVAGTTKPTGLVEATGPSNVPEPGTFALLGMGIVGLVGLRRKRVTA